MAEEALANGSELHLEEYESASGLPNRLLLPKGTFGGMEYELVVFISDGEADVTNADIAQMKKFHHYGHHGIYPDKKPHGYPFDRRVPDHHVYHDLHNLKETTVKVFDYGEHIHKYEPHHHHH